ncbi:MAG: hypothetical protein ACLFSQ_05800 [Candidatus Zixiibacteriota bacterium]
MRRFFIISAFIFAFTIFGEDTGGDPGKFMLLGQNARSIARGQAMSASPTIEVFSYNPASLLGIKGYQGTASYQFLALDRTIYSAVFGMNIRNDAAFALSWTHGGVEMIGRNNDGEPTGDLRNGKDNIALAFSKKVYKGLSAGVSVRYFQEQLSEISSYTAGFDIGLAHHIRKYDLRLGLSVQNLHMVNSWDSSELYGEGYSVDEHFPVTLRLGSYWNLDFIPVNLAADASFTQNRDPRLHFGASYDIIDNISVHAGLDHELPTGGLSINVPISEKLKLSADYGLSAERWDLPMRHVFGIRVFYDKQVK